MFRKIYTFCIIRKECWRKVLSKANSIWMTHQLQLKYRLFYFIHANASKLHEILHGKSSKTKIRLMLEWFLS